jgi:hypothetical protein
VAKKKLAKAVKKKSTTKSITKSATTRSAKKSAKKSAAKSKTSRAAAKRKPTLPRPTITADEKLFLLFKDDYHARQIFDFLRVDTVRELEQFPAAEIVKRLSQPIAESVERIRRRLAEKNRYLSGDEEYLMAAMRKSGQ